MRVLAPIALVPFVCAALNAQAPLAKIDANDHRIPAGTLKHGVLGLHLEIVRGMWFPDADNDPGVDVYAFAETGHAPSIPGPLIRVPVGTEIRTTVHNARTDSSFLIRGLSGERGPGDTVRIQPGETRELITHATSPGTFLYEAETWERSANRGIDPRVGDDRMLAGALIVDEPGQAPNDRVLVMLQWINRARVKPLPNMTIQVLTINGKSWPHTERLAYDFGDTIRWRVINASRDVHAMHLHGAYFMVDARGTATQESMFAPADRRRVVTERMLPLTTMRMEWTPSHAGNWIFHCHMTPHIMPHAPLADVKASTSDEPDMPGMAGLVMGVLVHGPISADPKPRRHVRLLVQQFDSIPNGPGPRFGYALDHEAAAPTVPGPLIALNRGEPVAITVVNRALEPTAVHWHGLEIESYYDGVHGFGGHDARIAPHIAPGDSFIVKITPPRAGTFIYHTHFDEMRQQTGGLYGPLVVLEPGQKWDAEHERLIVIGAGLDTLENVYLNGEAHPTWHMKVGQTYRIRLINIHYARPSILVSLVDGDKPTFWNLIARDGADLPPNQAGIRQFMVQPTTGQTFDGVFTPGAPGTYTLKVTTGGGQLLNTGDVIVDKP